MSTRRKGNCGGSDAGIIALALGLAFLPIVGLFMMCSSDSENQSTGKVLFVIGLVVYAIGFICQQDFSEKGDMCNYGKRVY